MAVDMTPPPVVTWAVVVDSPELPRKIECEVSAMTGIEAQVRAAETALLLIGSDKLTAKFKRRKPENQVADVAKYAEATKK